MDQLDQKLVAAFDGRVVRKDLLHRIKKGTNVPTFVLEFLLARFCASTDAAEIEAGTAAVLATLHDNYVRPNESNAAQSRVATKGKHKFIDKVHVRYSENEKRHWASLENFNSQRVAIPEKLYRDNDRLLEGGIWAEVTIVHNESEDEDFAFILEDLRAIQLSRFDFDRYVEGRKQFTRDEWMDVILRSVGLEPSKLSARVKLHFIARLAPLTEANFNFIELGPRSTGKSYFFSEFSPYSTLVSGGQATKATLFYNNARHRIGLVGFWDTVAFDEVTKITIRDPDSIQIMKDFMANGRFSRGVEVIASASLAFVGNIDLSIEQVVNSIENDLFTPLPKEFDLAVMDRFACYLPGWEMPKNSSTFLTSNYGLITDFLAEAFHYQFVKTNRYEEVSKRIRLGSSVEGRDEKGIKKTICAILKILHPEGPPSDAEFEDYVAYAVECRRRVKEQMNKRKPDDEFASINLSFIKSDGTEVVVWCPESKNSPATQNPVRRGTKGRSDTVNEVGSAQAVVPPKESVLQAAVVAAETVPTAIISQVNAVGSVLTDQHFIIRYGDIGHSYDSIVGPYLVGAKEIIVEDPYIRMTHQVQNLVRFCEAVVKAGSIKKIKLVTGYDDEAKLVEIQEKISELQQSLAEVDVVLEVVFNTTIHDREIRIDNGWVVKIGRGLDFYQKPASWYELGAMDLSMRRCLETKVDIFHPAAK